MIFFQLKGLDKGTVSRVVKSTIEAMCSKSDRFIKWPQSDAQRNKIKADFFRVGGFPNVIGAVDGTHVRIQAPHEDELSFVNRKGFHSINVQAICDAEGNILAKNYCWHCSIQFTLNLNPLQHLNWKTKFRNLENNASTCSVNVLITLISNFLHPKVNKNCSHQNILI